MPGIMAPTTTVVNIVFAEMLFFSQDSKVRFSVECGASSPDTSYIPEQNTHTRMQTEARGRERQTHTHTHTHTQRERERVGTG